MNPLPVPEAFPIVPAAIAVWQGAVRPGQAGVARQDGYCAFACFEIPAVPDFTSARFMDLAKLDDPARIKRLGERQAGFLSTLHVMGGDLAASFRHVLDRQTGQDGGRIRLFLVGRAFGRDRTQAEAGIRRFCELVASSFPREYYPLLAVHDSATLAAAGCGNLEGYRAIAEILKPEEKIPAHHQFQVCGFRYFYTTSPLTPLEHGGTELCRALLHQTAAQRVMVDCCLTPVPAMTEAEAAEAVHWTRLAERWSRDQRIQVGGGLYSEPVTLELAADPNARTVNEVLVKTRDRYSQAGARCFVYACRVLADSEETARTLAAAWASFAVQREAAVSILSCRSGQDAFPRAANAVRYLMASPSVYRSEIWEESDAPETIRRLHRMADVKELATYFRLPIPGSGGCPGVPVDDGFSRLTPTQGAAKRDSLPLGTVIESGRISSRHYAVGLQDLTKHCLITGTPGSGKTTLCFSLLTQLWEEHRIPFVVLEPAKLEYRALKHLPAFRDDLLIFTVGNERVAPFRFNPLEPPAGIELSEHLSTLQTCFKAAFSLFDPLPMILDEALVEVYQDAGWSLYDLGEENPEASAPTLDLLLNRALAVLSRRDYKGEVMGNIRGALQMRLGSLTVGPKGRCFNTGRSVPSDQWLEKPVIFELDGLNTEEKALMMMFVLTRIRAHAKATRRSGAPLSHLVLVEEAHNVIPRRQAGSGDGRADPQAEATRFFVNMLAEMRALGEGMVVCDQLPTAVAPEAVKLTDTKVMHRTVSPDDRAELGAAMIMNAGQLEQVATLPPGCGFVFRTGDARPELIKGRDFKSEFAETYLAPTHAEVTAWMHPVLTSDPFRAAYLPFNNCGARCNRCDPRTRERVERAIAQLWRSVKGTGADAAKEVFLKMSIHPYYAESELSRHCVDSHLEARVFPLLHEDR